MTMHIVLHLRDNINRQHVSKIERGRGIVTIENSVDTSIGGLEDNIEKSKERQRTNRTAKTGKQKLEEKQLYGYFKRQTGEISHKSWTWWQKGNLKRETKSHLISVQNKFMMTYYIEIKIDKTQQNSKYRLCGDKDETINHVIYECSKLV